MDGNTPSISFQVHVFVKEEHAGAVSFYTDKCNIIGNRGWNMCKNEVKQLNFH